MVRFPHSASTLAIAIALSLFAPSMSAAAFGPPQGLGNGGLLTVADAHDGSQVAVRHNGSTGQTEVNVRRPGGPWGPTEAATTPGDVSAPNGNAKAAIDAAGNVTIAWVESSRIWTLERRGGVWGDPTPIFSPETTGDNTISEGLDVAASATGHTAIAYRAIGPNTLTDCPSADSRCSTSFYSIRLTSRPPGGSWRAPALVNEHSARRHEVHAPSVGIDSLGRATVAWQANDTYIYDTNREPWGWLYHSVVRVRGMSGTGTLGATQSLSPDSPDRGSRFRPELAVASNGQRDVVFAESAHNDNPGYITRFKAARGGPTGSMSVSQVYELVSSRQLGTQVSIDSNARGDTAVVGTRETDTGRPRVLAGYRAAGAASWTVDDDAGQNFDGYPSVSVGTNGSALLGFVEGTYDSASGASQRWVTVAPLEGTGAGAAQSIAGPSDTWEPAYLSSYPGPETVRGADGAFGVVWPSPDNAVLTRSTLREASAAVSGSTLTFRAGEAKSNSLTLSQPSSGTLRITDSQLGAGVAGPGCARTGSTTMTCDAAGVTTVRVLGEDGVDRIRSTLPAGSTAVTLDGGAGNDTLAGGAGVETLAGGEGDDSLDGGLGADTLDGSAGTDTITYATRTTPVAVRLDGSRNDGDDPNRSGSSATTEEGDLDRSIENAKTGSGPDRLSAVQANATVNVLDGGAGDDRLSTREGQTAIDRLVCGFGTDAWQADPSDTQSDCETALP